MCGPLGMFAQLQQLLRTECPTNCSMTSFTSLTDNRPIQVVNVSEGIAIDGDKLSDQGITSDILCNLANGKDMAFGIGRALRNRMSSNRFNQFEYVGDNFGVRKKNLGFMEEEDFSKAWEKAVIGNRPAWKGKSKDVRWRAHTALWAAKHGLTLEGDFVECGVFLGLLSLTICHALKFDQVPRNFFLFDTFDGIPEDGSEKTEKQNEAYFDCFELATKNFSPFPNAKLIKGALPGTLDQAAIEKIAYLSVDLNQADYEREVITELWDRLSHSAIVLIDDYAFETCEDQYAMWNEFAASKGTSILTMPTGSGIMIKP